MPSYTIDAFKLQSSGSLGGDIAIEGIGQMGFETLGEILSWIAEGIFDAL